MVKEQVKKQMKSNKMLRTVFLQFKKEQEEKIKWLIARREEDSSFRSKVYFGLAVTGLMITFCSILTTPYTCVIGLLISEFGDTQKKKVDLEHNFYTVFGKVINYIGIAMGYISICGYAVYRLRFFLFM